MPASPAKPHRFAASAALLASALALALPGRSDAEPPRPPVGVEAVAERCGNCHAALASRPVVHDPLSKGACTACHRAVAGQPGKCRSRSGAKWELAKAEPDLCYGCHKRLDQSPAVHTAVRQGSCLTCHDPHGSQEPHLVREPARTLCFDCHDLEPLLTKPVHHAPVAEGRCLDCHAPHGSPYPAQLRAVGADLCLRCHDARAPGGGGAPGPGFRIDLTRKVVHKIISDKRDCGACHELGHSAALPRLLRKAPPDLCYGCHKRADQVAHPHTAVVAGDCAVCHDPHSSNQPKLLARETMAATCFLCHQDDLSTRKVIHKPLEKGCDQCHLPHGGPNRNLLKAGEGKQVCYSCHQTPVDQGKFKHAAVERYGCTGCHDPHGAANRFLLAKKVNDLCAGCHPEERDGRHVTRILATAHPVGGGRLLDPRKPDRPFTCASCHNPHGSDSPLFFYAGSTPTEACEGCHGDKTGRHPEWKNIISRARKPGREPGEGAAGGGGAGAGAGGAGSGSGSGPATGGGGGEPGAPAGGASGR